MARYIEKHQAPVRIVQCGHEPMQGFLVLSARARDHEGPESVLDLLNAPTRVVPLVREPGDHVVLLNRSSIEWVAPDPLVHASLVWPASFTVSRQERVKLYFEGGRSMEGAVQVPAEDEAYRVSDFLNQPADFFPFVTAEGRVLVNKNRVREIQVFQASPRPAAARR